MKFKSLTSKISKSTKWTRVMGHLLAYILLVGGIETIISWDELSIAKWPIVVLTMSSLLFGGFTIGYIDRQLVRRFKGQR
jgi:hypothetical protein